MITSVAQILTPEVLIVVAVTALLAGVLTVALFVTLVSRTANKGIRAVQETGTKAIGAAETVIKQIAEKGAEIAVPLSEGVRSVLESVADRVRLKQAQFNDALNQSVQLAQEVERLKSRHIDVTKISAQLRLGLIEVRQQYYSFRQQRLSTTEKRVPLGSATATDYLGLHRATYRTQIGLDIDRLQFLITEEGLILVHGLREVEVLGMSDLVCDELLNEVRHHTLEDTGRSKSTEVLLNDARLQDSLREHRAIVLKEIQSPQSVHHLAAATADFGLAFLQACLGAGGLRVMESKQPIANGLKFMDLCHVLNQRVEAELAEANTHRAALEHEIEALQASIVDALREPTDRLDTSAEGQVRLAPQRVARIAG